MDLSDEKEKIYTLLHELIQERRELTKQYYELKERLNFINRNPNELTLSKSTTPLTDLTNVGIKKTDIEHQKYKLSKTKNESIPYDKVSIIIRDKLLSKTAPKPSLAIVHYRLLMSLKNLF